MEISKHEVCKHIICWAATCHYIHHKFCLKENLTLFYKFIALPLIFYHCAIWAGSSRQAILGSSSLIVPNKNKNPNKLLELHANNRKILQNLMIAQFIHTILRLYQSVFLIYHLNIPSQLMVMYLSIKIDL